MIDALYGSMGLMFDLWGERIYSLAESDIVVFGVNSSVAHGLTHVRELWSNKATWAGSGCVSVGEVRYDHGIYPLCLQGSPVKPLDGMQRGSSPPGGPHRGCRTSWKVLPGNLGTWLNTRHCGSAQSGIIIGSLTYIHMDCSLLRDSELGVEKFRLNAPPIGRLSSNVDRCVENNQRKKNMHRSKKRARGIYTAIYRLLISMLIGSCQI